MPPVGIGIIIYQENNDESFQKQLLSFGFSPVCVATSSEEIESLLANFEAEKAGKKESLKKQVLLFFFTKFYRRFWSFRQN